MRTEMEGVRVGRVLTFPPPPRRRRRWPDALGGWAGPVTVVGAFLLSGAVVGAFPWWPVGVMALPVLVLALCGLGPVPDAVDGHVDQPRHGRRTRRGAGLGLDPGLGRGSGVLGQPDRV